jgi:hypothetical protein
MIDDAGGNLAVPSRRLLDSADAEFPEDEEKSAPTFAIEKTAAHVESTSTFYIEEAKITRY